MRDRPSGADLLAIARETLVREVLPGLPEGRKLAGLMVARAIEIAQREAAAGDAATRAAVAAIAALYGEPAPPGAPAAALADAWTAYARRLVADLRAGALPPAQRAAAWQALLDHADARLAESNPRLRDEG